MTPFAIPAELSDQIDELLSHSKVLAAICLLREATNCSIADAKCAIGTRFNERFPDQCSSYRNLGDEDYDE
ncbi:hypothetical protein OKA05_20720 [Luteolibacter arcticus]|uniref:Uncharacterized protein n=1 Tax=Luteolibacter arcticus TaxID=1581411 RepID=A0ABT3GND3_9BACT|nr:hypothetical protein [Luteolibacter arcticus]MCW1924999.1 hypothetical protein [Luteolibacter arcticus]